MMDEKQKEYFTGWIKWCEIGTQYIPLSFLLGFFVAVVVARWWEQVICGDGNLWYLAKKNIKSIRLVQLDQLAGQIHDGQ